jgi:hypothetical protein
VPFCGTSKLSIGVDVGAGVGVPPGEAELAGDSLEAGDALAAAFSVAVAAGEGEADACVPPWPPPPQAVKHVKRHAAIAAVPIVRMVGSVPKNKCLIASEAVRLAG